MAEEIVLKLSARPAAPQQVEGWESESFTLAPGARDVAVAPRQVVLDAQDVLEIELDNGQRLLVAGADAEQYLGNVTARDGAGSDGRALVVGPTLRLRGAWLPPETARDGTGAWFIKAVHVFREGPQAMTALALAGVLEDRQLENRQGLYRIGVPEWSLSPEPTMESSGEAALLFVHGTASSCAGSFKALWDNVAQADALAGLRTLYGSRIYGFEHRSLTESPVANALAIVQALPPGARVHLVSHSRGGLVGELLARANRVDADPFTEAEIQRFLDEASATGRTGHEADAEALRQLNAAMKERRVRFERFVRVAATARGTTLASGRLDRWATVMLNLLGYGLGAVPPLASASWYPYLKRFLLAVVKERTDARVLPGLEAQMPDSPLVALLNAPDVEVQSPLHVIAGDYAGRGLLAWLGDFASEAFYGGHTDLVVNTPSMIGGARRRGSIWLKAVAGPEVNHFSYFRRQESVAALLGALAGSNERFTLQAGPSTGEIARGPRGGVHVKPLAQAPIALMLPGIMGSSLGAGGGRVWLDPLALIPGGIDRLGMGAAVSTEGWIDLFYERFAQHLAQSHEVRPFVYDWRLSIVDAADRFGQVLDAAMDDAVARGRPVRIVAHSMGGLVARLALQPRWSRFKGMAGSRLVQFGTPNGGSHSIAVAIAGRDAFVQMLERLDWKHDMRELLDIVRGFPGFLELLPWPGRDADATDAIDYFDPQQWKDWLEADAENRQHQRGTAIGWQRTKGAGDGWDAPDAAVLQAARAAVQQIAAAPLDPEATCYVAGQAPTPVSLRFQQGAMEVAWTDHGDGRVPYATGIPPRVKAWFVAAAHGDLLNHEPAFPEYVRLIETGNCNLPTAAEGARGGARFAAAPLRPVALYPTPDELAAAALGGRMPAAAPPADASLPRTTVRVVHGSLAAAQAPVLIGAYGNSPLRGTAQFLDRHLGGRLQQLYALGRYPAQAGEVAVFDAPRPAAGAPPGAIVVGLGAVGQLEPGGLTRVLASGLLEFAQRTAQARPDGSPAQLRVAGVLVGTGFGGLTVETGMRCMFEALLRANQVLQRAAVPACIGELTIFEEEQGRVIAAAAAAQSLAQNSSFKSRVEFALPVEVQRGAWRSAAPDQSGSDGWRRVHVSAGSDGGLSFTLVTQLARNEVTEEPSQRQAVDGLIGAATGSTADQPGLSRALFELMVPNGFKPALPDLEGLVLALDPQAAAYPWELMRDEAQDVADPLAVRVCVVRQLATEYGRRRVPTVAGNDVFVVGDTQSGFAPLPGAQKEAEAVGEALRRGGFRASTLLQPDAQTVLVNLFDRRYRVVHLAAHGTISADPHGPIGLVLGKDTYLTSAQVRQLRHVPELVFINCCHLGSMKPEANRGRLAANLATEFIEMGCKAVVAAGWAVDDAAAQTFATTFYAGMLQGLPFGQAVRAARQETQRRHPASNTWGAYQAYGDERFRLIEQAEDDWEAPDYVHPSQLVADVRRVLARLDAAAPEEVKTYLERLHKMGQAARRLFPQAPEVQAAVRDAQVWAPVEQRPAAVLAALPPIATIAGAAAAALDVPTAAPATGTPDRSAAVLLRPLVPLVPQGALIAPIAVKRAQPEPDARPPENARRPGGA